MARYDDLRNAVERLMIDNYQYLNDDSRLALQSWELLHVISNSSGISCLNNTWKLNVAVGSWSSTTYLLHLKRDSSLGHHSYQRGESCPVKEKKTQTLVRVTRDLFKLSYHSLPTLVALSVHGYNKCRGMYVTFVLG